MVRISDNGPGWKWSRLFVCLGLTFFLKKKKKVLNPESGSVLHIFDDISHIKKKRNHTLTSQPQVFNLQNDVMISKW